MQRLDELISLLAGPLTMWLVSYVKGNTWSTRQRYVLSLVASIAIAALSAGMTHALIIKEVMTLDDWIENAMIVFISATSVYKLYFENTQAEANLENAGPFSHHLPAPNLLPQENTHHD